MTPKQREEHQTKIIRTLIMNGWSVDRWGNYKKTSDTGKQYRVKVQKTSMRLERKMEGAGSEWFNVVSDYFKNIVVVDDHVTIKGKVIG